MGFRAPSSVAVMDLPASDRFASNARQALAWHPLPWAFVCLGVSAAGVISAHPVLAQCAMGLACGIPAGLSPLDRGDLPGQNVVTSTTVTIEAPSTTTTFAAASDTSTAPAPPLAVHSTEPAITTDHLTANPGAAATGAALLRLQPSIVAQDDRSTVNDTGGPSNLWNAESILYKLERTAGSCSLNRQGPQINTCR